MSRTTDTIRSHALMSNDGMLRGTALAAADIMDEQDAEILRLRAQVAALLRVKDVAKKHRLVSEVLYHRLLREAVAAYAAWEKEHPDEH